MHSPCRRLAGLQTSRWTHLAVGRPLRFDTQQGIRGYSSGASPSPKRSLLTLAIETSCDDTCVALLSKHPDGSATLHHNATRTSDNRAYGGVFPSVALAGHTLNLGQMVAECLPFLPDADASPDDAQTLPWNRAVGRMDTLSVQGKTKRKPDFVSVTRGPGMLSNLSAGLNTAKGIATAWQVPLLGVNHMQAHALTPRLVAALERGKKRSSQLPGDAAFPADGEAYKPAFPFLSLLVSGGHTMLVHSRALNDHRILAGAPAPAVGDAIDKAARLILPPDILNAAGNVMYGRVLESFAFPSADPDYGYRPPMRRADEVATYKSPYGWHLKPPLPESRSMVYDFSGFGSQIQRLVEARPDMIDVGERRVLARETMRMVFEHLASRVVFALDDAKFEPRKRAAKKNAFPPAEAQVRTLVVSGGVASNRYLMHILRSFLDVRGHGNIEITAPPPALCTDNAAMIAWTGIEMYEAGYETQLSAQAIRKWTLDPTGEDGGILGLGGWVKRTNVQYHSK